MKRTLCAVLSALFLSVSAIPCAATDSATPLLPAERRDIAFADIPAGAWYADAVKLCYEAGVLNGTSETTFSPQETLTAAQLEVLMARVKWRLEGNTEDLPAAPPEAARCPSRCRTAAPMTRPPLSRWPPPAWEARNCPGATISSHWWEKLFRRRSPPH